MTAASLYLSAKEAAAELGVSVATLYAYVSRGRIRSVAREGTRARLYVADDVRRAKSGSEPPVTGGAPRTSGSVLDSALTLIGDHALYYRGRDAIRLAGAASLESVATLLWDATFDPFAEGPPQLPAGFSRTSRQHELPVLDRMTLALSLVAASDPYAHNFTPEGSARTGARIVRLLLAAALDVPPSRAPSHELLAAHFRLQPNGADLVRMALVLSADHELNASTFAVRVVASTGASLHRALAAGLAALGGPEHGGMTERTDALLTELFEASSPGRALAERLRRGDGLPGFGHPLYPNGDPRARLLLRRAAALDPEHPDSARLLAVTRAARDYAGLHPTLDFALSALALRLGLPRGTALLLFAVGRSVGWIAHAVEQRRTGELIRPRARYVGEHPA